MSLRPKWRASWIDWRRFAEWSDMAKANKRRFFIMGIGIGWLGIGMVIGKKEKR